MASPARSKPATPAAATAELLATSGLAALSLQEPLQEPRPANGGPAGGTTEAPQGQGEVGGVAAASSSGFFEASLQDATLVIGSDLEVDPL